VKVRELFPKRKKFFLHVRNNYAVTAITRLYQKVSTIKLPQADRVSAFVVKIFLAISLITMQNVVAVSHTVRAHVGGPKFFGGRWGPAPLG